MSYYVLNEKQWSDFISETKKEREPTQIMKDAYQRWLVLVARNRDGR